MKLTRYALTLLLAVMACTASMAQNKKHPTFRTAIPRDSIRLSDPCILADDETRTYYMTGTGGLLWKSKDLDRWDGPYIVAETDPDSWMGHKPQIWAAELHKYKGKYYYFATFTNDSILIGNYRGNDIPRRACHVLESDRPEGPYRPMKDKVYLPANVPTLDGTLWEDTDGKPYMIYCGEWLQNWNGTIEKIALKTDLSGTTGKSEVLFRASDSPWSRETGTDKPNRVTDGPWLFRTGTGRLGMLWTSWIEDVYTQGVAYSESGTLEGPWIQETEPITPPNYGHGMLFKDFNGRWLMSVHSHNNDNGRYIRIPQLFEVDLSGDKLKLGRRLCTSEQNMGAYLFVFFSDPTHSLFMATSRDGYTFTAVNDGQPIISGDTIAEQRGIRDPHIYRGPDGAFYLAMTDLHIFAQREGIRETEWERDGKQYGWGNNRGLVLMKSHDLIHWTHSNIRVDKAYPDKFGDIGCAWAPETIYDPQAGKMMIYFTMRHGNGRSTLYYAYTDNDFTQLTSEPKQLFEYPDPKIQILDADISLLSDGRACMMYVAQENPGGIRMAISNNGNVTGPYRYIDKWIDFEPGACEAPNVWKRIGEDKWVVMYDIFSIQPHNFGFCETSDFKHFTNLGHFNEGAMKAVNFISPKHGTVIQITPAEADALEAYWKQH